MSATQNQLMQSAACFNGCIPPGSHKAVQNYLLANIAGGSIQTNVLMQAAAPFQRIPIGLSPFIQAYLLREIASNLGATITDDPHQLVASFSCDCFPAGTWPALLTKQYVDLAIDLEIEISSDPSTLLQEAKCYLSCIPKGMQDVVMLYLLAQIAGVGTDVNAIIDSASCYDCIPLGLIGRIQFGLIGEWRNNLRTPGRIVADDWADRVVANGGAMPSENSIAANADFVDCMIAAGLWTKMVAVNTIAPDSLIAAITPLLVGPGNDPWTNVGGFVAGNLNIQGLVGNGINYLNTGVNPSTALGSINSCGLTTYVLSPETTAVNQYYMGANNGANNFMMSYRGTLAKRFVAGAGGADAALAANCHVVGFISGNRTGGSTAALYHANGGIPHHALATSAAAAGAVLPNDSTFAFALNFGGAPTSSTSQRLSFLAIHQGLTQAEDSDFYDCVQALRVAYGGGFIADNDDTDQVLTDFTNRLSISGGAAMTAAQRTALETFWNALIAAGIHNKMYSVCCVLPGSAIVTAAELVRAHTPFYRCDGYQSWINNGPFVTTDLTVNGLVGTGNPGAVKYLDTAVYATDIYPDDRTGGLSLYVYDNALGTYTDLGARTANNQLHMLYIYVNSLIDDCFNNTAGSGRLLVVNPHQGYVCGSRLIQAGNDHNIYIASSTVPHTSAVGDDNFGGTRQIHRYFAYAYNNVGVPGNYSLNRHSFLAIHSGLTSVQSNAFYNAIQALRTTLGGGFR